MVKNFAMFICVNIKVGLKSHLAKTNMFTVYGLWIYSGA